MKNLRALYLEVIDDMDALDIPYSKNIVEVTINRRAKARWGLCRRRGNNYYIQIAESLLDDSIDDMGAKNTIAHEIIHTCPGCMNHGTTWKMYADRLSVFGYLIKRTDSAEDKGVKQEVVDKTYKYIVTCGSCGSVVAKNRRSTDIIKELLNGNRYGRYCCARCKSTRLHVSVNF